MTIMVRVMSAKAMAQLQAVKGQVQAVDRATQLASRTVMPGRGASASLVKWGSQLQWAGRQIQYNFTIPLAIAGLAAAKWQLDNEKAFTHVKKVYGDTAQATQYFNRHQALIPKGMTASGAAASVFREELGALDKAFVAISNRYGVQQKEVLEVAGAWAAAGQSGEALAQSVNATMQAMIIGDMKSAKATDALISIQAQYNLSSSQLTETLAQLNAVENATGINMQGLIEGFTRAAGVAREAGIDTRHLAAMLAALVPATGSAAQAGNALKTIISRLMAPTKEATQVMNEMGLGIRSVEWQGATAMERLQMMAKSFNGLSASAKNSASSVIASRWQINKFSVLMKELNPQLSYYERALDSTSSRAKVFATMQRELNAVLESNPQSLKRMWVILQNALAQVIQPMLPYLVYLTQKVANMVKAFSELNPHLQKMILLGLGVIAVIGPLAKLLGASGVLFGVLGSSVKFFAGHLGLLGGTFVAFDGQTKKAHFSIIRLLKAFTVTPILIFTTVFGTVLGGLVGITGRSVAGIGAIWKLLPGFLVAPVATVKAIWAALMTWKIASTVSASAATVGVEAAEAATRVGIWSGFTLAMSGFWTKLILMNSLGMGLISKTWILGLKTGVVSWGASLALIKVQLLKFQLAWMATSLQTTGIFSRMWLLLRGLSAVGLASLIAQHAKFGAIIAIWKTVSQGLIIMWTRTWGMIGAINGASMALIRAQWLVSSIAGVGIWGRFAGAMKIIWTSIAASGATAMKSMFVTIMTLFSGGGKAILSVLLRFGKFFVSPWGIAIAAVIGIFYHFRSQIQNIWNSILAYFQDSGSGLAQFFDKVISSIIGVFHKLPEGVQGAMIAVATVIRDAALAIYGWFQYINPFAHHSPSLVENVERGMARVNSSFASLSNIKKYTSAAYSEIKKFGQLTASLGLSAAKAKQAEDRGTLKKSGSSAAVKSYDQLVGILNKLTPIYNRLNGQMQDQQQVVNAWQSKVDKVNDALDIQVKILDRLQGNLDNYQSKLDSANQSLQEFASAPLVGMRAMEDQIFTNTMAQNRLKLAMMDMEDTVGTLDDVRSKLEAINGAQELLRGEQSGLRAAGAGSDITKVYDEQIKSLENQKSQYEKNHDALNGMESALSQLQRQADRLDLVKSLKFDELQYQISAAADTVKELSFDEVMSGIQGARNEIARYTPQVQAATAAVAAQQAVVDRLTASRDKLQDSLDVENQKLEAIKSRYNEVNDAIQAINSSLSDVIGSADKMNQKLAAKKSGKKGAADYVSPGLENFRMAKKGDFPDPGGAGIPIRTDWKSQLPDIDKFTEQMTKDTASAFAGLNPFAPLKKKATAAWDWIKSHTVSAAESVGSGISKALGGDKASAGIDKIKATFGTIGKFLTGVGKDIGRFVGVAWKLLGPDITKIFKKVWEGLVNIFNKVGPEVEKFGKLFAPVGKAIKDIWAAAKPIIAILIGRFLFFAKIILSMVSDMIEPALTMLGDIFAGVLKTIRGVIQILIGILTLDPKMIWDGIVNVIVGPLQALWGLLKGLFRVLLGAFLGFVRGIWGFFVWLYDVLLGHSIIPDIINGIFSVFKLLISLPGWIWDHVLKPIWDFFVSVWSDHIKPFLAGWWGNIKDGWAALKNLGSWFWNNVLKPVWGVIKDLWDKYIVGSLKFYWKGITNIWGALKSLGTWLWDNALKPVFTRVKNLWTNIKEHLGTWWGGIKNAFSSLKGLPKWVGDNVFGPVKDRIISIWRSIRDWFNDSKSIFTKPIAGVMNVVINAINAMIKGLNKIADTLPGLDWSISLIPKLAEGGELMKRHIGAGFKTTGARAIVGEGKANYPEYVIPTDPTHRRRATALLASAASKMGSALIPSVNSRGAWGDNAEDMARVVRANPKLAASGMPMFESGGILGGAWDTISKGAGKVKDLAKGGADWAKGNIKKLASLPFSGFKALANHYINKIGWKIPKDTTRWAMNKVVDWVSITDDVYAKKAKAVQTELGGGPKVDKALRWAKTQQGKPYIWGGVGPTGYDCSGFMSALTNVIRGKSPYSRIGATGSMPWGGFNPGTKTGFTVGWSKNYGGSGIGHTAGTLGKTNVESRGGIGVLVGPAARGYQDSGFSNYAGLTGLKYGGIVRRRAGGMIARLGEGSYDEAVTPLPRGWRGTPFNNSSESKEINFYGDLSFPNIKSGDDAESFIRNLEILSKD